MLVEALLLLLPPPPPGTFDDAFFAICEEGGGGGGISARLSCVVATFSGAFPFDEDAVLPVGLAVVVDVVLEIAVEEVLAPSMDTLIRLYTLGAELSRPTMT